MRRNGWKGQKAESAGQPSDSDHSSKVVADDLSSPELSCQDEKSAKAVSAESESTSAELKQPCCPEEPRSAQDGAALEVAAETATEILEEVDIGEAPNESGDATGEDEQGEAVGWIIQLTRGRIVDVTDRHVVLSNDSLGFITFDDGEAMSIEGIRRIGW